MSETWNSIPYSYQKELEEDSALLSFLQECGVNNWDGYDEAIRLFNKWKENLDES